MFLHGHPKLHTVRHITRSKENERALLQVPYLIERARRVDPGVMSQQGMLEKNGAARSFPPGNEVRIEWLVLVVA